MLPATLDHFRRRQCGSLAKNRRSARSGDRRRAAGRGGYRPDPDQGRHRGWWRPR